jgi:tRNA C32,U32 (ribose-2'-O)-methylase TrmJ
MDHFAQIQKEFVQLAYPVPEESVMGKLRRWFGRSQLSNKERNWWESLSREKQQRHLQRYPQSKFRIAKINSNI